METDVDGTAGAPRQNAGFTITIPMPPPRLLMANQRKRLHWSIQSEATRQVREDAAWVAKAANLTPVAGEYVAEVEVVWGPEDFGPNRNLPDVENIPPAIKPVSDGLVDAGVIDDDRYCVSFTIRQRRGDTGAIIYTVREAQP